MARLVLNGRSVDVSPRQNALEALHAANAERRVLVPAAFFTRFLLDCSATRFLHDIPSELDVQTCRKFHTGTAFVVSAKGKALGQRVETQFSFAGETKTLVYKPRREHGGLVDVLLLCDQGFRGDEPQVKLTDVSRGRIITREDLLAAPEVAMSFKGEVRAVRLTQRHIAVFERVGDEAAYSLVSDKAGVGLGELTYHHPLGATDQYYRHVVLRFGYFSDSAREGYVPSGCFNSLSFAPE